MPLRSLQTGQEPHSCELGTAGADVECKSTIDVYIARQPIFRRDVSVHGYELLYRGRDENCFDGTSPEVATCRVMVNAFTAIGADKLLNNKPAFLNLDGAMLTLPYTSLLPARSVVIEILEFVEPSVEVLEACRGLKKRGFTLALDDCSEIDAIDPWRGLVEIVKVDFRKAEAAVLPQLVDNCRRNGMKTVAEKVETAEEFKSAAALGFDYYQGYFFARPQIVKGRAMPESKLRLLQMLREVSRDEIDLQIVERFLLQDVALTYKLLRYLNSGVFGWKSPIKSVRHALALLGEEELRKWICLLLVATLGHGKPAQLMVDSLARARFGELLSPLMRLAKRKSSVFLLGLLSHLDAILNCTMEDALSGLCLEDDVRDTLLVQVHRENAMGYLYTLMQAYERGDWVRSAAIAEKYRVSMKEVTAAYFEAVHWADAVASAGMYN